MLAELKGYARGITFCSLWYLSILAGFYLLYCPCLPLLILAPELYRSFTEILFVIWETYPVALMQILMGTKITIVGDIINPKERSLIVMNHRTRLDWNYLWAAMFHGARPAAHRLKFVLKSAVRHMPGLGWIMQMTCFLYIHRSWERDQHLMGKVLDYFKDIRHTCQLLLFAEGTDLTKESKMKSDKFADTHKLPKYDQVLHPKTTGFAFLTQVLRNNGQLDSVYDITIAYPRTIAQTELDMVKGRFPEEVHFRITRHGSESIPVDEGGCRQWLNAVWQDKENTLKEFYSKHEFNKNIPRIHEELPGSTVTNSLHLSMLAWTCITFFAVYAIFNFIWFQIWVTLMTVFFIGLSFTSDGLQHFEIGWYYARKQREKCE